MDYSNLFVCLMGLSTVFLGLICLIFLINIMSVLCGSSAKGAANAKDSSSAQDGLDPAIIAVITAAIEADLGRELSHIRLSIQPERVK